MQKRLLSTCCALSLCIAGPAAADTVIKFNSSQKGALEQMAIKDGKVLISSSQSPGRIVMDTGAQKMVMINDKDKKFMEMDEKYMEQSANLMNQMRQQMMSQLQNLPPEQRKAVEQQMGIAATPPKPPEVTIKATGQTKTVSGVPCEIHEVMTDGKKSMEACMATPEAAKINVSDYATLKKMQAFSQTMMKKSVAMGGGGSNMPKELFPSLEGLPMELKDIQNNFTMTITAVESASLNAKDFLPGDGYQKFDPIQQMQQMQQQKQQQAPAPAR